MMRRITPLLAIALTWLGAADASAQEGREALRSLERRASELRSDVNRSYLHLRVLANDVLSERVGGRVQIEHVDATGPLFRLVSMSYSLDGRPLRVRADAEGIDDGAPVPILDGPIGPGEHTLSVVLRYRGDSLGVIGYMPGYHFVLRSSYSFVSGSRAEPTRIVVRPYTRGPLVPFDERLRVEYERP